jgi:vancomycin resistance protein VanW
MRRHDPGAHELLEQGKCVNVALAAPSLHGVVLDPGRPFSFWRAVGPPTAALGYRHGIEVRGGCVVPSIGGGLCLLTNALFRAAAEMNWVILERHGHTLEAVPSADEPWGVDATAAWPYIDLRFAVPRGGSPARLGVRVDGDVLVVEVWTVGTSHPQVELMAADDRTELIEGHRIRSNRIVRRSTDELGVERVETIAVNTKRLLDPSDLARNCLTCDLTGCAGRVTVP